MLKVYARDIDDYENFLLHSLTRIEGIGRVKTMFVLSTLKREIGVPVGCVEENGNGKKEAKGS